MKRIKMTTREYNEKMHEALEAALAMPRDTEFQRALRAEALENLATADMLLLPVMEEEEGMTAADMVLIPAILDAAKLPDEKE